MKLFLQKHYEKLVLGFVLLVVAIASLFMVLHVQDVRQTLAEQLEKKVAGKKKPLKQVDLTNGVVALQRLTAPEPFELSGVHNTFNPVTWMRDKNQNLNPVTDPSGVVGLVFLKANPLNLTISYLGPVGADGSYRYQFEVTRNHDKNPSKRRPTTVSLTVGSKNDLFLLRDIKGPKDTAPEAVIELLDGGDLATISTNKPFSKTLAWSADLDYKWEKKQFLGKRTGESLNLGNAAYKVVAIDKDEVVVSAPNSLRSVIKLSTTP